MATLLMYNFILFLRATLKIIHPVTWSMIGMPWYLHYILRPLFLGRLFILRVNQAFSS